MLCAAKQIEVALQSDRSVAIIIRCDKAYEAAVLYDDVNSAVKNGNLSLEFEILKASEDV